MGDGAHGNDQGDNWVNWSSVPWQQHLSAQLAKSAGGAGGEAANAMRVAAAQLSTGGGGYDAGASLFAPALPSPDDVVEPYELAFKAQIAREEQAHRQRLAQLSAQAEQQRLAGGNLGGEPFAKGAGGAGTDLAKSHLADDPWFKAYAATPFWNEALSIEEDYLKAMQKTNGDWSPEASRKQQAAQNDLALKRIRWMRSRAHDGRDGRVQKSSEGASHGQASDGFDGLSWSDFEDPYPAGASGAPDTPMAKGDDDRKTTEGPGVSETAPGHKTPPKEHREAGATKPSDYADPENLKYPIHDEEHVDAAIKYFSKPKNAALYPPAERAAVWGRIKAAAKKLGIEVSPESGPPSEEEKKSMHGSSNSSLGDIRKAIADLDLDLAKASGYEGMPAPGAEQGPETVLQPGEDVPVAQQLHDGDPKTAKELARGSQGSGDGGIAGGGSDGGDSNMYRGPHDAAPIDVYGAGIHDVGPVRLGRGAGSLLWTQGEGSQVLYSSIADHRIAKAIEDGTIDGGMTELGAPRFSPLYGLQKCRGCGTGFAKALTVCPDCRTDQRSGSTPILGGLWVDDRILSSLRPPAPEDAMDYGP